MPTPVTAFSVKIASLGSAAMELSIVREVIGESNSENALVQKRILLPLDGEAAQNCRACDLLISFCSDAVGTTKSENIFETEIPKQLADGKPVLIYLSEARTDLTSIPGLPSVALSDWQKRFPTATVDSYGDEKELRAKFARQLEATILTHPYFNTDLHDESHADAVIPEGPCEERLSCEAQTILMEACDDFEAYIGRLEEGNSLKIQANGKQLVGSTCRDTVVLWDNAFKQLLRSEYIREAGCNGRLFQISAKGFEYLKTLGKSPVGYIAEMGGM